MESNDQKVLTKVNHPEQLLGLNNKTIITEKYLFLARWNDHFITLLNEPSTVEQHTVDKIKQRPNQH